MQEITLSIISHSDGAFISKMLENSSRSGLKSFSEIIIRENAKHYCDLLNKCEQKYKNVRLIYNNQQFGFGKNHNLNFAEKNKNSKYFVVCNPDIYCLPNIHNELDNLLYPEYFIGSASIDDIDGSKADFMRTEIHWAIIFLRFFVSKNFGTTSDHKKLKWVPSVFTVFSSSLFQEINGYDENIFMYYEDYDICRRSEKFTRIKIFDVRVKHIGQRSSRKKIKSLWLHIKSICYVLNKKRIGEYNV
jgi:N-acetylglucosaminyl-diphospho-decaprenol L-rhamnosyltransferase